jgi:DNA-binding MarR family transcriptional regulator
VTRDASDPVIVAVEHWRKHGWETGWHFAAGLSIYRTDDLIRLSDEVALRPRRLTRSRHEALAVLFFSRHGEMPLGKLSEHLLVHPTSVTTTVDTLERLGLVERVGHPSDRRATLARITTTGRRAMEETCRIMSEAGCGLATLTEREAERLFRILAKVRADAGDIKRDSARRGSDAELGDPILVAERNWESQGWTARPHFRASLSIYRTVELIRQSNVVALRPHKLTHVRHEALALLYFSRHQEMPMGKLSERLLVHPTSVTSTVDTLERLGLVRRVAHPTDRRATLARITPKGTRAIEASNTMMARSRFGLGALTEAEAKGAFTLLAKVRNAR